MLHEVPLSDAMPGRLYRVARPGRALGRAQLVSNDVVRAWIGKVATDLRTAGLLGDNQVVHYVCLLGWRADGRSEIADQYDARGPHDAGEEATVPRLLWQDFLNGLSGGRLRFVVHHFPTTDGRPVPDRVEAGAATRIRELLQAGCTVLVGCSAAIERTGQVLARAEVEYRSGEQA
jgi:hypothetical protein